MFNPNFTITPQIATYLMRIEAIKQELKGLPLTVTMLAHLRQTARFKSTHYSTQIEGNRLTQEEVINVINKSEHFPERERDEKEVLGYYIALEEVERIAQEGLIITEELIKRLHGLVMMSGGKKKVQPTPYREGQNVIRDGTTRAIVYMPPQAEDVPLFMYDLVEWLKDPQANGLPYLLRAGIAHYQYATIHPYYDGNGRTARLLATLLLHKGGYGLKGIYSLEEYYAKNLHAYYQALDVGPSHNYYSGRAQADITPWLSYFCSGMVDSFTKVRHQALKALQRNELDESEALKKLTMRQRAILTLFKKSFTITAHDIEKLLKVSSRTARALCQKRSEEGFLVVANKAKKTRAYQLSPNIRVN